LVTGPGQRCRGVDARPCAPGWTPQGAPM
jgi:hypothetical protein